MVTEIVPFLNSSTLFIQSNVITEQSNSRHNQPIAHLQNPLRDTA